MRLSALLTVCLSSSLSLSFSFFPSLYCDRYSNNYVSLPTLRYFFPDIPKNRWRQKTNDVRLNEKEKRKKGNKQSSGQERNGKERWTNRSKWLVNYNEKKKKNLHNTVWETISGEKVLRKFTIERSSSLGHQTLSYRQSPFSAALLARISSDVQPNV